MSGPIAVQHLNYIPLNYGDPCESTFETLLTEPPSDIVTITSHLKVSVDPEDVELQIRLLNPPLSIPQAADERFCRPRGTMGPLTRSRRSQDVW